MALHRVHCDVKTRGDLLVSQVFAHQSDHLSFAARESQRAQVASLTCADGMPRDLVEQRGGELWGQHMGPRERPREGSRSIPQTARSS